jgi:hypothetical protein
MSRIHALVLALALGTLPAIALAEDTSSHSLEQVLIDSASTPKEHQALASYYAGKAAEARKEAESHRSMGKTYSGAKGSQLAAMKDHCEKLATLYDEQAKEFDAMAAAHTAAAKK